MVTPKPSWLRQSRVGYAKAELVTPKPCSWGSLYCVRLSRCFRPSPVSAGRAVPLGRTMCVPPTARCERVEQTRGVPLSPGLAVPRSRRLAEARVAQHVLKLLQYQSHGVRCGHACPGDKSSHSLPPPARRGGGTALCDGVAGRAAAARPRRRVGACGPAVLGGRGGGSLARHHARLPGPKGDCDSFGTSGPAPPTGVVRLPPDSDPGPGAHSSIRVHPSR